ncbi:MAG: hypothetical protein ACREJQ_08725, partial [bacterium]
MPAIGKPFAEVVKGLVKKPGLFTLYVSKESAADGDSKDDSPHLYFEVGPDQLEKHYEFMSFLETGLGAYGVLEGEPVANYPFTIRKIDNRLQWIILNPYFRSDPKQAQTRAVERAFTESLWVG